MLKCMTKVVCVHHKHLRLLLKGQLCKLKIKLNLFFIKSVFLILKLNLLMDRCLICINIFVYYVAFILISEHV